MTETQPRWAERLTSVVGGQVERYRLEQRLRGEDLARRCTALGYRLDKHAVSKLETGTRKSVSVSELLVLAAALGVPPLALVLPLRQAGSAELLPEAEMDLDMALSWIEGQAPAMGIPPQNAPEAPEPYPPARIHLGALREHARYVWRLRSIRLELSGLSAAQQLDHETDFSRSIRSLERDARAAAEDLRDLRRDLSREGWQVLPGLTWDIEEALAEVADGA